MKTPKELALLAARALSDKKGKEIQALEAAKKYDEPRYEELLLPFYEAHALRRPAAEWPEPVVRSLIRHLNKKVYVPMQGPSEMGASGILLHWDRTADLKRITVPTLVIAGQHDTMDPAWMRMMSKQVPRGDFLLLPNSGHMPMYDDQQMFFDGLLGWLHRVDDAR